MWAEALAEERLALAYITTMMFCMFVEFSYHLPLTPFSKFEGNIGGDGNSNPTLGLTSFIIAHSVYLKGNMIAIMCVIGLLLLKESYSMSSTAFTRRPRRGALTGILPDKRTNTRLNTCDQILIMQERDQVKRKLHSLTSIFKRAP